MYVAFGLRWLGMVMLGMTIVSSLAHAEGSGQERYDLQDPKSVLPDSRMPKLKYTDDELKALIDFLLSLK